MNLKTVMAYLLLSLSFGFGCVLANMQEVVQARYWVAECYRVFVLHDHFSAAMFKAWPGRGSREGNLLAFCRENNLIGQSRSSIHAALGGGVCLADNGKRYSNREAFVAEILPLRGTIYFELQYCDDKVSGWRFRSTAYEGRPFVRNNPWATDRPHSCVLR